VICLWCEQEAEEKRLADKKAKKRFTLLPSSKASSSAAPSSLASPDGAGRMKDLEEELAQLQAEKDELEALLKESPDQLRQQVTDLRAELTAANAKVATLEAASASATATATGRVSDAPAPVAVPPQAKATLLKAFARSASKGPDAADSAATVKELQDEVTRLGGELDRQKKLKEFYEGQVNDLRLAGQVPPTSPRSAGEGYVRELEGRIYTLLQRIEESQQMIQQKVRGSHVA
jgi:DNA repair exonuclease SbcCD ATPase subunit